MIFFFLGVIVGLLVAALIVATLTYFKKSIEHRTTIVEKVVSNKGPSPRGFIFDGPDEATEARNEIIARNKAQGKDTPLSELM